MLPILHSFQRWNETPSFDWLWAIATIDDIPMRGLCDRSLAWPASYPSGALESPGNSAMNLRGNLCWFAIEYTKKAFWESLAERWIEIEVDKFRWSSDGMHWHICEAECLGIELVVLVRYDMTKNTHQPGWIFTIPPILQANPPKFWRQKQWKTVDLNPVKLGTAKLLAYPPGEVDDGPNWEARRSPWWLGAWRAGNFTGLLIFMLVNVAFQTHEVTSRICFFLICIPRGEWGVKIASQPMTVNFGELPSAMASILFTSNKPRAWRGRQLCYGIVTSGACLLQP